MKLPRNRFAQLYIKHRLGTASDEEEIELSSIIQESKSLHNDIDNLGPHEPGARS